MEENFKMLLDRVIDTLNITDLTRIKDQLNSIKGNTIFIGAGGSSVVAEFAKKVLDTKGINTFMSARDLNYQNINLYDNIMVFSYSGKGYVLENSLHRNKNVYLLTNGNEKYNGIEIIKYDSSIEKENSFISLASTLMPISIIYYYYDSINYLKTIQEIFRRVKDDIENSKFNIKKNDIYEIIGGLEYSSSIKYLETTMIESGISIPVIHDKYDYCHGRSTTSYKNNNSLIYFNNEKELDVLMLEEFKKYYMEIIKIKKYSNDYITNDYYGIINSMFLTKQIAKSKNKDLSKVEHSPLVYRLYKYRGEM
ncbi:MAG TPA: hypothetical protein PLV83_00100 [Bacilli bacterium]|nr:hypothetical protein [Bacilli bacterium]